MTKNPTRRLPSGYIEPAVATYAQLTGEMLFAWNKLHEEFAFSFSAVLNHEHPLMARTLWISIASDTAQRDMLVAAISMSSGLPKVVTDRLIWAVKQAQKLSVYRNDVVHTPIGYTAKIDGTEPNLYSFTTPMSRFSRHLEIHLPTLLKALRGDLMQLSSFVSETGHMAHAIRDDRPKPGSLPRKPRLRTSQLFEGQYRPPSNQKPKKPRRQPRPSRP